MSEPNYAWIYASARMSRMYEQGDLVALAHAAKKYLKVFPPDDGDWRRWWRTAAIMYVPIDTLVAAPLSGSLWRCYERDGFPSDMNSYATTPKLKRYGRRKSKRNP